jgi:hypothetical protein
MRRAVLVVLAVPALCAAQSFQGLDMRKRPPPAAAVVVPASPDYADGDPIIAVPPRNAQGKLDLDTYKTLFAALKERFGKRLVGEAETLKALEGVDPVSLATVEGQKKLTEALKAQLLVLLTMSGRAITAGLLMHPGGTSVADAVVDLAGGKLSQGLARKLVADLLKRGGAVLQPAAGIDVSPPEVTPEPTPPPPEEPYEDVASVALNRKAKAAEAPLAPSGLNVFVGAGAAFRALLATGNGPVVPQSPTAMAAMGFDLTVFPLRFVPSLADGKLAELGLEGTYRYNLVRGDSSYNGVQSQCAALDDEMRGQLFYRYPLGGRLPKIGLGVGLAQERTRFASACTAPALNTTTGWTEFQLKVQQPILGEVLSFELSGGPGILFSERAAGYGTRAWSLEGWFTARPLRFVAARLGARFTSTRLTTWPEGVSLIDNRTFVGLELGATL